MICIKCKEKIPILSNLDFEQGIILLYCQCDNENKEYNIREYMDELEKIKEEQNNINNNDINIDIQKCFVHKNNNIELFCIDCSKELCYECNLKTHQKNNHQLCKLDTFFDMIENNIKYYKALDDLFYFSKINQKYIYEIIKFIKYAYESFYEQRNKKEINFSPLKNICYIELRLYEYDSNKKYIEIDTTQKKTVKNSNKINYNEKINNIRHYSTIKKVNFKNDNNKKLNAISFFNVLLIPNSFLIILISPENKLLVTEIIKKENDIEKKIIAEFVLNPKNFSSIYKLSLLNDEIFALIYTSGSFDLFFIEKKEKINLIRKKYACKDNKTNIINQMILSKEKNKFIVLMNDKIKIFEYYNENENISFINEIDRNNLTLLMNLNYHESILSLFDCNEIVIKDQLNKKNYIIKIREKNVNLIYEIINMNYLAISHFDNIIDIFDMNLMVNKTKLIGHQNIVNHITELIPLNNSNYKTKLISCSDDNTIRIWDLIHFNCDLIITLESQGFLCKLNILPNKEIMALTDDNSIYIIE